MSRSWSLVPLREVLQQHQEYIEAPESRLYPKLSVKLYGKGVYLDTPADGATLRMKRHQIAKTGQVILSEIWGKKGAIGFVPPEGDGALCTSHFFLFDVLQDRIEPGYLQAIFTANYLQEQLDAEAKGTTGYAAVRPNHLLSAGIPLPPLEEQRRIVARIEGLAVKIEEARRLRTEAAEEAKAFASSLHLHMAGERFLRLDAFLMLEEVRENVRLGQEYPQVGVRGFGEGLFEKGSVDGSQTTYKAFNRLYYGAVVLSQVKGWEGALAVCCSDLSGRYVSPEYRTFRCVSELAKPEYLAVIFATPWFWTQLKNMTRGVGARRERIRPEQFLRMEIPMPTIQQQTWAMQLLARLSDLSTLQAETRAELDAMLPSTLDKAFKGEL